MPFSLSFFFLKSLTERLRLVARPGLLFEVGVPSPCFRSESIGYQKSLSQLEPLQNGVPSIRLGEGQWVLDKLILPPESVVLHQPECGWCWGRVLEQGSASPSQYRHFNNEPFEEQVFRNAFFQNSEPVFGSSTASTASRDC